jgi:poly(3-hydroxybutyrate) depolymerase
MTWAAMTWAVHISVRRTVIFLTLALSLPALASDFPRHALSCDGRDMEYVVYVPANATGPLPVLMLLHGAGDEAENFIRAWKSFAEKRKIVLIAPQLPRDRTLEDHIPKILPCLVEDVRKVANLDSHRIYLFGYSMGGYLAYDGALLDSDYFAAAAIHAMGIDDDYVSIVGRATRKIPIAISIGDRDQMVSLAQVRKTRDLLKKSGFPVEYKEIFDHTHNYYEISATINEDAWHFLEGKRLP